MGAATFSSLSYESSETGNHKLNDGGFPEHIWCGTCTRGNSRRYSRKSPETAEEELQRRRRRKKRTEFRDVMVGSDEVITREIHETSKNDNCTSSSFVFSPRAPTARKLKHQLKDLRRSPAIVKPDCRMLQSGWDEVRVHLAQKTPQVLGALVDNDKYGHSRGGCSLSCSPAFHITQKQQEVEEGNYEDEKENNGIQNRLGGNKSEIEQATSKRPKTQKLLRLRLEPVTPGNTNEGEVWEELRRENQRADSAVLSELDNFMMPVADKDNKRGLMKAHQEGGRLEKLWASFIPVPTPVGEKPAEDQNERLRKRLQGTPPLTPTNFLAKLTEGEVPSPPRAVSNVVDGDGDVENLNPEVAHLKDSSVPKKEEENQSQAGGIPPPPPMGLPPPPTMGIPPPPMGILPPPGVPPPPLLGRGGGGGGAVHNLPLPPPTPPPSKMMKRLHWKALSPSSILGSVWEELVEEQHSEIKADSEGLHGRLFKDFESRFKQRTPPQQRRSKRSSGGSSARRRPSSVAGGQKRRGSLLHTMNEKKACNVGIGLSGIKLKPNQIVGALRRLDMKVLSPDTVTRLVAIFPSQQEIQLSSKYRGNPEDLDPAERFFNLIATQLPTPNARLQAALMITEFSQKLESVRESVKRMQRGCLAIRESRPLRTVLKAVLKLGNFMNTGKSGYVYGFKLSTLPMLVSIRSAYDKKLSLLGYIVTHLQKEKPGLAEEMLRDLAEVPHAVRIDVDALESSMQMMASKLTFLKGCIKTFEAGGEALERVQCFHRDAEKGFNALQLEFKSALQSFRDTCGYFGQHRHSAGGGGSNAGCGNSWKEFFGIWNQFTQDYLRTQNEVRRQQEIEARKKKKHRNSDVRRAKRKKNDKRTFRTRLRPKLALAR